MTFNNQINLKLRLTPEFQEINNSINQKIRPKVSLSKTTRVKKKTSSFSSSESKATGNMKND